MATITQAFALSTNQSRKTDVNIIMASSPLHHANPTRRPIPSVDIPHCLRVSYNSGVTHYRDTNIVILWLQHDDEEDGKIPRRRHRHRDNTTVTPEHSRWRHTPRRSLTRSSRQVLNSALPSGAIQSVQPPFSTWRDDLVSERRGVWRHRLCSGVTVVLSLCLCLRGVGFFCLLRRHFVIRGLQCWCLCNV